MAQKRLNPKQISEKMYFINGVANMIICNRKHSVKKLIMHCYKLQSKLIIKQRS